MAQSLLEKIAEAMWAERNKGKTFSEQDREWITKQIKLYEPEAKAALSIIDTELLKEVSSILESARKYIDSCIDVVDGDYGIPEPNNAMILAEDIDKALQKIRAVREL